MRNKNCALITGATSGFGYEFAKLLAKEGHNLVLVARSEPRLQEVCEQLNREHKVDVWYLAEDLFLLETPTKIYRQVKEWGLSVDVLVNDAAQGEHGKFIEYDLKRDLDLIHLNIGAVVSLTKMFLIDMVARKRGRVLQVGSILSKYPTPLMAVYGATKAFVLSFSEALINELEGTGVTMTLLLPGAADTDFFHKAGAIETVTYKESDLYDPVKVAKDGFEALMSGQSRIVSGTKAKLQAAASNVMPDQTLASSMRRQMDPSDKETGRTTTEHPASREERHEIEQNTGKKIGDY